jgi:formamidopyrimidine-DNA glycosylase
MAVNSDSTPNHSLALWSAPQFTRFFNFSMPELPEVEVTRLGIAPHIEGRVVESVLTRRSGLRWPFPPDLARLLAGQRISHTGRRGKYLLIHFSHGTLIVHLGMSGHLRVLPPATPPAKHDHIEIVVSDGHLRQMVRMTDPRRFGAVLWHGVDDGELDGHMLLRGLGVEPLGEQFSGALLHQATRGRSAAIKQVLLAGDIVVGVGNIYACESLFRAGIHPKTSAARISRARYDKLAAAIRTILAAAITQGGSTLRDFIAVNGQSGYFQQTYFVYDRENVPCRNCGAPVRRIVQGQRSTFYCVHCQR